jgi:alpha-ketoglutarate-dependent taurine dioxygenase
MSPADATFGNSREVVRNVLSRCEHVELVWEPGELLVVDNWRVIHARGEARWDDSETRVLERVLVA